MKEYEKYMSRCLTLAKKGSYDVAPNPMVGAVIVHENRIIGEGYHRQYGGLHAEPIAIQSVAETNLLGEATLYVSLEPCAHLGKTPPCADLIVEKGIKKVVIGSLDPNPKVAGKGVEILQKAGVEVVVGVLEKECYLLNRRFLHFQHNKVPYITLKWAQTNDGFIDKLRLDNSVPALKISTPLTQQLTHKMRAENMAIMVGSNTALLDNPSLSVRHWRGRNPIRIVIDRDGRIPPNFHIFSGETPTIIFTENDLSYRNAKNIEFVQVPNCYDLSTLLQILSTKNIHSILVEGGATLHRSFIDAGLWNEANIEVSTQPIGKGVSAITLSINKMINIQCIDKHRWIHYMNETANKK